MTADLRSAHGAMPYEFDVHVRPGAKRSAADGVHDGLVAIRVSAPPADGQANDAVCRLVATMFEMRVSAVEITRGLSSRRKHIRIAGDAVRLAAVHRRLLDHGADPNPALSS